MTDYVISYDLKQTNPNPHSEFIKQATARGWSVWILASNDHWYRLPNTTLIGNFPNRDAAKAAFDAAVAATSAQLKVTVIVEKFFLATYADALFNSDIRQPKG